MTDKKHEFRIVKHYSDGKVIEESEFSDYNDFEESITAIGVLWIHSTQCSDGSYIESFEAYDGDELIESYGPGI